MKKFLLVSLLCIAMGSMLEARLQMHGSMCSEKDCAPGNCKCYCSVKCGPRDQDQDDDPIYTNRDAKGKAIPEQCYCKEDDADEYNRQCRPNAPAKIVSRRESRMNRRQTRRESRSSRSSSSSY